MKNDIKKLTVIMNDLAEEFEPNLVLSDRKIERWDRMLLQKYGIDKVLKAADNIIKTRKFNGFPKIFDMVESIEGSKMDLTARAMQQYSVAKKAMNQYRNVQFDDPIIHIAIGDMGGWPTFCMVETKDIHWQEKEFVEKYCIYADQYKTGSITDIPTGLLGVHASSPSNMNPNGTYKYQKIRTFFPIIVPKQIDTPNDTPRTKNVLKELKNRIKSQ